MVKDIAITAPFFPFLKSLKFQDSLVENLQSIILCLFYFHLVVIVDQSKGMLGNFAPQREPYVHSLDEEITPSGVLARGIYSAKLKVSPMCSCYHSTPKCLNHDSHISLSIS